MNYIIRNQLCTPGNELHMTFIVTMGNQLQFYMGNLF